MSLLPERYGVVLIRMYVHMYNAYNARICCFLFCSSYKCAHCSRKRIRPHDVGTLYRWSWSRLSISYFVLPSDDQEILRKAGRAGISFPRLYALCRWETTDHAIIVRRSGPVVTPPASSYCVLTSERTRTKPKKMSTVVLLCHVHEPY